MQSDEKNNAVELMKAVIVLRVSTHSYRIMGVYSSPEKAQEAISYWTEKDYVVTHNPDGSTAKAFMGSYYVSNHELDKLPDDPVEIKLNRTLG